MSYINWHYFEVWPKLFIFWRNLTLFPYYYFSISLHLSHLFASWKRQRIKMGVGFHLDEFFGVVGFNIISRIIGAIIRIFTIIYGLFFITLALFFGFILLLIWTFIPGISVVFFLFKKPKTSEEAAWLSKKANNSLQKLALLFFKHDEGRFIAAHLGFIYPKFIKLICSSPERLYLDLFNKTLIQRSTYLKLSDLSEALAKTYKPFKYLLDQNKLKSDDVYNTAVWYETLQETAELPLIFDLNRIKSLPGIGTQWAYGYTVEFDKYSSDLTQKTVPFPILTGREKELSELQRILLKTEGNNALIVGEPGVARHRMVETFAHRILIGQAPKSLSHKRVLLLNMHQLVSSEPSILEAKGLASKILDEAAASGNIITVIDDIDEFLSSGEGKIDLTDIFTKLAESSIGVIGITTPGAYHKYIETNPSLSPLFETITIESPTMEVLLRELEISIVPVLENKYRITITYPAIKKTIENADRFISSTPFPAKAIELIDQAAVFLTTKKARNILFPQDIDDFLSEKYRISIGVLQAEEKNKLLHLEELLHQRVINQETAIHAISSSLRRSRLEVSSANKPIGSFLFLGPTGVGKTETAKALSAVYYGSEDSCLRFDMSQYQEEEGLERLIGSIKLGTPGELTGKISDHPFSLLLLDEFEKADKEIYNLFLTLLDEGYVTNSIGKKVNAKNTIIIATSNAGGEFIREQLQQGLQGDALQKALLEYVQREKIFSPELLNRFDSVVVFSPLSEGQLKEVARLQLAELNKRLAGKDISVAVTAELIKKLAALGFDPQWGARAMKRVIAEKIEDQVAQKLLSGNVKKGEEITISL